MGSCASAQKGARRQGGASAPTNAMEAYGSRATVEIDENAKRDGQKPDDTNDDTDEDEQQMRNYKKKTEGETQQRNKDDDGNEDDVDEEKEEEELEKNNEEEVEEDAEAKEEEEEQDNAEEEEEEEEEKEEEEDNANDDDEVDEEKEADVSWYERSGAGEMKGKILDGQIDMEIPSQFKLVRIFTSSTFTDTFIERNSLMERVYPKLKEYCQSHGYDFQVVDMRWGVRDEATDDHMTSELCMRELRACQKFSVGPNFITFLGQKYGYRPFPPKITQNEFEAMLAKVEKDAEKELLTKWFVMDENLVPAMYILQPIRSILPNYNNRDVSAEARSKASSEWWSAFEAMQLILREASKKALKDQEEIDKYCISVTEDEIRRGILRVKNKKKHCYWFKRNITDLKNNLDKGKARMFIDKTPSGLDEEAVALLDKLKGKLLKDLPESNVTEYDVEWCGEAGINPKESDKQKTYVGKLCKDFYDTLVGMIDEGIQEKKEVVFDGDLVKEVSHHAATCQDKSRVFFGREAVLDAIIKHVDKCQDEPDYGSEEGANKSVLVVYGPSGCGKTSIMAVAAKKIKEKYPSVPMVLRFVGTTSESSSVNRVLYGICEQLCHFEGLSTSDIPKSFKNMVEFFSEKLKSMDTKLVIILDSLDQFSPEDGALAMKWLPKEVSHNVAVILSTLPGEEYKTFPALKNMLPESAFVEVPVMPDDTAGLILDAWLKDAHHTITEEQMKIVMKAFDQCPLPLFLKLSFDEAVRWKSYSPKADTVLQSTVTESINGFFARLERLHGSQLVSHGLAYITAAKNGLSDAELDDILSIDDEVLNDVYQYWTPPVRRVPPLLWIRVKTDLGSYIVSRGADGVLVNNWYHRQFIETARERYIKPENEAKIHAILAEYFLGRWSGGILKPFTSKQGDSHEKDRLVPAQPNIFPKQEVQGNDVYNYRKLNELPWHLIKSRNLEALKDHVIFSFDFLSAKLCAFGLRSLLQDLNEALEIFKDEKEIKLLRDTIQMSGEALLGDPHQLASQLNGRLGNLTGHEKISDLINQSRNANVPCLYPTVACFDKPGGPLIQSLAGHTSSVQWATATKDSKRLLSVAQNNTVKTWDLENGTELRSYEVPNSFTVARFYNDDKGVILAGFSGFLAMDLETEEIAYHDEYLVGQYGTCMDIGAYGTTVVHAGASTISVFEVNGKDVKPCWSYEETAATNDTGFYDIITAGGNYYAYTRGDMTQLTVRKCDDKGFKKKLKVPYVLIHYKFNENGSELITLASNSKMQDQYKQVNLVIWDTSSWNILQDIPSKFDATIINVYDMDLVKLETGWEVIWPVIFQINFWNINTGHERVALKSGYQGNQYKQAISPDGKQLIVVSMDTNQRAIDVYDLDAVTYIEGGDKHLSAIEKTKAYVGEGERDAFLAEDNQNIALSIPPAEGVVTIWDLQYRDRLRRVRTEGIFPSAMQYINEKYMAIWDYNTRKIYLLDYIEEKVEATSPLKVCELAPSTAYSNTWQYMGNYEFIVVSENGKDLNRYNLKTGKLIATINTGESKEISNMLVSHDKSVALLALKDYESTTVPAICIDLNANKKLSKITVEGQRVDLRPETIALAPDGKTAVLSINSNSLPLYDVKTGKEKKRIHFTPEVPKDDDFDYKESTTFSCILSSAKGQFMAACISGVAKIDGTYQNCQWLACFDIYTHEMLVYSTAFYYTKMQVSQDGSRIIGLSQPIAEEAKSLEMWDTTGIRQGKLRRIAKFLPDTDLRFNHLAPDGQTVIAGIAGVDGLVFLRLCGGGELKEREEDCKESKIVVAVEQNK